jgi:hypothetical protein
MHELPFGSPTAEEEISDSEHYATRLYVRQLADRRHEQARAAKCRFIVGQRGTGKTALGHYLKVQTDDPYSAFVLIDWRGTTFSRVQKAVQDATGDTGLPYSEDVARLWTLVCWIALMTELSARQLVESPAVNAFTRVAHGEFINGTQVLLDGLASLVSKNGARLLDWDKLPATLNELGYSRAVEDTRNALDRLGRVAIVVDLPEDCLKSSADIAAIVGLLMAVNRTGGELHENVHVKCLVTTEVWSHVTSRMPGIDRYNPLEIRWTPVDLLRLMCYRYNSFLGDHHWPDSVLPSSVSWESPNDVRVKVWEKYFPPRAEGCSRFLEDSRQLIVRHSQLRPRQVIAICNSIASRSALRRFNPDHVTRGLVERVDWIASQVLTSYVDVYPDAEAVLARYLGNREAVFRSNSIDPPGEVWDMAYQMGIVGPVVSESAVRYAEPEFSRYQNAEFEFCASAPRRWRPHRELVAVHPIFHRRFNIHETAESVVGFSGWWGDSGW